MYTVGEKLRITYYPSWTGSHKDNVKITKEGTVIFANKYYYTVQFADYKESFYFSDKKVKVEVLHGNKRVS